MKLSVFAIIAASLCISCASTSQVSHPPFKPLNTIKLIEKILPEGWKVVEQSEDSVPRGLVNKRGGYFIKLEGPRDTYMRVLTNGVPGRHYAGRENIKIWLMPSDFMPRKPSIFSKGWPFAAYPSFDAVEASNKDFMFYALYTETPSWPTWGKDIYTKLNLIPSGYDKLWISEEKTEQFR